MTQVRQVINSCRPDRQLVLFSATFNRHMEALARQYLVKPVEVQIGGRSVVCSDVEQIVVSMLYILVLIKGNARDKICGAEQNQQLQMLLFLILKYAISNNFLLKLQNI